MPKKKQMDDPPPKVWPFPTWKGAPYKIKRQRKPKPQAPDYPEALF